VKLCDWLPTQQEKTEGIPLATLGKSVIYEVVAQ
jgi:hypothetical protein